MYTKMKKFFFAAMMASLFVACSDDDDDSEYLFEREVTEITVLRECLSDANKGDSCYQICYHYPMSKDEFTGVYLWLGDEVVDDSAQDVSDKQIEQADGFYAYPAKSSALYDTIDLTSQVKEYIKTHNLNSHDRLHVALFCDYSDNDDVGAVQHAYVYFGDSIPPSDVKVFVESKWTTGARFEWLRPTDQTDYYKPMEISGAILGYNVVIHSDRKDEDLHKLKVKVETNGMVDSLGETLYKRHARIRSKSDSVWVGDISQSDKNFLRFVILDGSGYDFTADSLNKFVLSIDGLKSKSEYSIGVIAWDSSGNSSRKESESTVDDDEKFFTTDSIAPLIANKIFTIGDTLFPGHARLDSNNRLRIFWDRAVDLFDNEPYVSVDSLITLPSSCKFNFCYDTIAKYSIERYDSDAKSWISYRGVNDSARYNNKYYVRKGNDMVVSTLGTLVTDTIRGVSPGDTVILRIRAIDKSGYYSEALVDTIFVSLGELAVDLTCPDGFVAVASSDTTKFCMERLEHRNADGEFVTNVLHSEAIDACESISAEGFKVGLCNERDWELVCLSGGNLSYGVVEDDDDIGSFISFCNIASNDSSRAANIEMRNSRCVNTMGVRDMPGQYQEWTLGRSLDTLAVLKGSSYKIFEGLDFESIAMCTNRFFPYYTRLAYTTDTVYLYREGTKVDTVYGLDTTRTLYKMLTKKDFRDSLQFFEVQDTNGSKLGMDYALYSEYRKGGKEWLEKISNGLVYKPDHIEVVFLTGETVAYREVSSFYKSPSIGFRCCAYPE